MTFVPYILNINHICEGQFPTFPKFVWSLERITLNYEGKYYRPKGNLGVVFSNNKGQVAQTLVKEHKCVPVELCVEILPSKFA